MKICNVCGSSKVDDAWSCSECGNKPPTIEGFRGFAPSLASENAGFRAEYFDELARLEAENFWFRARNDLIVWALRRYFPAVRSFLEIGCGTGFVLSGIHAADPSIELSGSEIFSAGLELAAARVPSAQFSQMDARHLPFREEFDVIGAFDVLEHIEEDTTVLSEVAKAVRPGGGFIATAPQHPSLWSLQDEHAHHVRRYTAGGLRRKVEAAGFEILRSTSFVSLLLPTLVAARLRTRGRKTDVGFDVIDELRQPHAVNVGLEAVMTIERTLIQRGLSFPAGGSLLVVARMRTGAGAGARP
jgi:SAM-dependent methyltransferase